MWWLLGCNKFLINLSCSAATLLCLYIAANRSAQSLKGGHKGNLTTYYILWCSIRLANASREHNKAEPTCSTKTTTTTTYLDVHDDKAQVK